MENQDCYHKVTEPKYECVLFDVDDILYPPSSGIPVECTKNIVEYMINKLQIEEHKAPEMCALLYKDYGTTMAGLRAVGYDFDYDDYHSFVHGKLPYEWLKPDHTLRSLLLFCIAYVTAQIDVGPRFKQAQRCEPKRLKPSCDSLPIRKVIFSNGNDAHVAQILSLLGIEDCFDGVICFETLNPTHKDVVVDDDFGGLSKSPIACKPFENAFEQAFKVADVNPRKTFFDDSIRNLQTAKALGLQTVQVGKPHRPKGVDIFIGERLKAALPELWEAREKMDTLLRKLLLRLV